MKMKAATEHAELVGNVHSNAWKRHLASMGLKGKYEVNYAAA